MAGIVKATIFRVVVAPFLWYSLEDLLLHGLPLTAAKQFYRGVAPVNHKALRDRYRSPRKRSVNGRIAKHSHAPEPRLVEFDKAVIFVPKE